MYNFYRILATWRIMSASPWIVPIPQTINYLEKPQYHIHFQYHSITLPKTQHLYLSISFCLCASFLPKFCKISHNFYLTPLSLKFGYVEVLCMYFLTSLVLFDFDKCSLSYWGFILTCPVAGRIAHPRVKIHQKSKST